ncbi:MAG: hypothetical protein JO345_25575 [Streptosporangiaceae bacterium]|nr:hypothetical protein [Streptosporangiaceae bacterium]
MTPGDEQMDSVMPAEVRCSNCGALVPDIAGPVHAYMHAAPGCWALYTALEDWKAAQAGGRPGGVDIGVHLVDSYAAQHAANAERRNRQSVAVHLMSLCAALEHGRSGAWRRRAMGAWTHREYRLLEPRPPAFDTTIRDVADAPGPARPGVVQAMAEATWGAWSVHHSQIRAWLAEIMSRGGSPS